MSDPDTGFRTPLTLSLQGPDSEAFQISPEFGIITTNVVFDRETNGVYSGLILTVNDGDGMESNATLDIQITDANDNSPVFSSDSLSIEIPETASVNFEVTVVNAQDLDEGDNAFVTYSLSGENLNGEFEIDSLSGAITVAGSLDYETIEQYILNVTAMDEGSPPRLSYLAVEVNIQDENDNMPVFLNPDPTFTITENAEVGTSFGLVTAVDDDSGSNAAVVYAIVGGNGGNFLIDPTMGNISTNDIIDRESQDTYTLIVEVKSVTCTAMLCTCVASTGSLFLASFPVLPTPAFVSQLWRKSEGFFSTAAR